MISEGKMSDEVKYELNEERAAKAYDALLKYLAASPRSEKECREKLYQKGYHKNEVEYAVERAKKYRYVNDEEYVRTFLSYYGDRLGKKKLAYKLTVEKGVAKDVAVNLIEDLISDDREEEKARAEAEKYARGKKLTEKSDAGKVYAHLVQKGYESDVISKIVQGLFDVFCD